MMTIVLFLLLFSGLGCVFNLINQASMKHNWQKTFGESFFIGILIVIAINNLSQLFNINLSQVLLFRIIAAISSLSIIICLYKNKKRLSTTSFKIKPFFAVFLGLLIIHLSYIILQNKGLPLIPWDAWNGWIAKAKVWHFYGILEHFIVPQDWLINPGDFSNATARYPDALPLLYVFNAGLLGWNVTALNAIYPAMFIAFLFAFYGNLKILTSAKFAIVATFILASLPFVASHIILAGYADIWVAALLFLCLVNIQHYIDKPNRTILLKIIIFSLALLSFKLIAWVWLLILGVSFLLVKTHKKTKTIILIIFTVLVIIWYWLGGFSWQTPFGLVAMQPDLIQIPGLGSYKLIFLDTSKSWLEALFYSKNWHLLWYSLPFVLFLAVKSKDKTAFSLSAVFLSFSTVFLFVLFYMTYNSVFADDFTSSNRIVLHIVPIYILFLLQVTCAWLHKRANLKASP